MWLVKPQGSVHNGVRTHTILEWKMCKNIDTCTHINHVGTRLCVQLWGKTQKVCVCVCVYVKEYKHVSWQHVMCVYSNAHDPVCNCHPELPFSHRLPEHFPLSSPPSFSLLLHNISFHYYSSTRLHLLLTFTCVAFLLVKHSENQTDRVMNSQSQEKGQL